MKKAMTITYEVGDNLYINITNKCPCACTFCIRNNADGAYGSDPLWLEHEPSVNEIMNDICKRDLSKYNEIVFCGYGEPTCRLDTMLSVIRLIRGGAFDMPVKIRLNTNGLSDLINERSTAGELSRAFDTISISLNAPDKEKYMAVTRPKFPNAFESLKKFTSDCVNSRQKVKVVMSVVDVISPEEIEASRKLAESLGAELRVRSYDS